MTGDELRARRINRGASIRGLARELDIPEQTIRRLEDGEGARLDRAKRYADWHKIRVTDLPAFEPEVEPVGPAAALDTTQLPVVGSVA
jgi:transcriptional regulator with XRE-family HTH domain